MTNTKFGRPIRAPEIRVCHIPDLISPQLFVALASSDTDCKIFGNRFWMVCVAVHCVHFSRMRSKGFPFIVLGSGGWTLVRLEWLVGSSSRRRHVVVGSLIPCLWGKLQNLSFLKVSTQVVMSLCVAGVALCDIPTCLITCQKCQNWRKARFAAPTCLVSSLWFSCGVAVSIGEAAKPLLFEGFQAGCHASCCTKWYKVALGSACIQSSTGKCFVQAL